MAIEFTTDDPPVGEDAINGVENRLGFRVPVEFRQFLLERNGGTPAGGVACPVPGRPTAVHVTAFLGVKRADHLDIETVFNRVRNRVPRGLLPAALGVGDDLVCLSVRPIDAGSVWYWQERQFRAQEQMDGRDLTWLAHGFAEFRAQLYPAGAALAASADPYAGPDATPRPA